MFKNIIVSVSMVFGMFIAVTACFVVNGMENVVNNHSFFLKNLKNSTYTAKWLTINDAINWAVEAQEGKVSVCMNKNVEIAVEQVINETFCSFAGDGYISADLVAVLHTAMNYLLPFNVLAATKCGEKLSKSGVVDNYHVACCLLFSQCNNVVVLNGSAFFQLFETNLVNNITFDFYENLNEDLVSSAIHMLRSEQNGHKAEALQMLSEIKQNKKIGSMFQ